jgi:hypothetical protein
MNVYLQSLVAYGEISGALLINGTPKDAVYGSLRSLSKNEEFLNQFLKIFDQALMGDKGQKVVHSDQTGEITVQDKNIDEIVIEEIGSVKLKKDKRQSPARKDTYPGPSLS